MTDARDMSQTKLIRIDKHPDELVEKLANNRDAVSRLKRFRPYDLRADIIDILVTKTISNCKLIKKRSVLFSELYYLLPQQSSL